MSRLLRVQIQLQDDDYIIHYLPHGYDQEVAEHRIVSKLTKLLE